MKLATEAVRTHQELSGSFSSAILNNKKGLIYHQSYVLERLKDIKNILDRMQKNRKKYTRLAIKGNEIGADKYSGISAPSEVKRIWRGQVQATDNLKTDLECLYIFANMTLDQWAKVLCDYFDEPIPGKYPFREMIAQLERDGYSGKLLPFWNQYKKDILWLYYQIRFYRNVFIEHLDRPWQRGTNMAVYGTDFQLFIVTPPNWMTPDKEAALIKSVDYLMPRWLKDKPDDYWEKGRLHRRIEVSFTNIDDIEKPSDREALWKVFKEIGGTHLSFEVLANRLLSFLTDTATLIK